MAYKVNTYSAAATRQDLLDIIKDISPDASPFAQHFPLSSVQRKIFGDPILYKLLAQKYEAR